MAPIDFPDGLQGLNPEDISAGAVDITSWGLGAVAGALFDSSHLAVFATNADAVVLWANQAARTLTGHDAHEFVGQRLGDVLQSEKTDQHAQARLWQHYRDGLPLSIRIYGKKKSGDGFWAQVELLPYRNTDGKLLGHTVLAKDVSDEMLTANRYGEEARDQLLAGFSHDVRTPLGAAVSLVELLQDTKLDPVQADLLKKAKEALNAVRLLVSGSLAASVSSLQMRAQNKTEFVNIPELFGTIESSLTGVSTHRPDVELRLDCQTGYEAVEAHRESLYRVLSNLMGNAMKFTTTGFVILKVEAAQSHVAEEAGGWRPVRFSVIDTGSGMSMETLQRINAPFDQASSNQDLPRDILRFEGVGLGLALVRQMLHAQGCTLNVETAPGKGSIFSFEMLCRCNDTPDTSTPSAVPSSDKPEQSLAGLTVLVVDDNAMSRLVCRKQLERLGVHVLEAVDGIDALDTLVQEQWHRPDAVLLDINMPRMDGPTLAGKLQSDPQWKHIPLVALSAALDEPSVALMHSAGVRRFVQKPFERHELARALADLL